MMGVRKRFGDLWQGEVFHQWERFDARALAFAQTGRRWTARVEYALPAGWSVALDGAWREGTVISYSFPPREDLVKSGKPLTLVDTFEQRQALIAYYFPAETRQVGVEVMRTFERVGLALRHEVRRSFHAGPGYENAITSLRFSTRF